MPKRTDIRRILIIGSGPVTIGQTCEFDYFGAQARDVLREEGFLTVVVDSDPAATLTNPEFADAAYVEPLSPDSLSKIIGKENPDALLAITGGQTALNLVMLLSREKTLERMSVSVLGPDMETIARTENRRLFKETMQSAGIDVLPSGIAESIEEGMQVVRQLGFPVILRPAYTTGGAGSAVAYNIEEYVSMLAAALETSPINQVLIERAALGWKEVEVEVLRDCDGSALVMAISENIDPMGTHTGDSMTVLPAQTLGEEATDKLTDLTAQVVETLGIIGASTVRFALEPRSGEIVVIGANPRLGRNTALVSKSTGIPIARIAVKLAVGYTLSELGMSAPAPVDGRFSVKMPRFAFDRFPDADTTLNTSMKAIGEVVGIGLGFNEALQKAIRSLEIGRFGLGSDGRDAPEQERTAPDVIREKLAKPNPARPFFIRYAIENGMSTTEIVELSKIDPVFIEMIRELVEFESELGGKSLVSVTSETLRKAKALGYSDAQLAILLETEEEQVRLRRRVLGIEPVSGSIPTFDGRSGAAAAYFYSTYADTDDVAAPDGDKKILVLGGGPNRIGQGSEFDNCRVHACEALREEGYESIIISSNPDAVSTDFAVSDRLYMDPLTRENILSVIEREKPAGIIVQFAGQSMAAMVQTLKKVDVPVLGTSIDSINKARDRKYLAEMAKRLGLGWAPNDAATSVDEVRAKKSKVGYPMLVRAGRMVGGLAAEIVYDDDDLTAFLGSAIEITSDRPLLMDKFLEGAVEVGVDAISDGETAIACGVKEFIEQAGVHSGDSACSLPPYSLSSETIAEIKRQACVIAKELGIRGLFNVQFAVRGEQIYVLEVHPRASRTLPFVSSATGIEWTKVAVRIMLGKSLREQGITGEIVPKHVSVKETVFPFARFANVDVVLGPEMKSTGEVMGLDDNFGNAYIKAQIAAGQDLPEGGTAFVSVSGKDKSGVIEIGRRLRELGFDVVATKGTADVLREAGVDVKVISKIGEGRPDAIDLIKNGEIDLIINTPSGKKPRKHEVTIRSAIAARGIPIVTTMAGAKATLFGMEAVRKRAATVRSLQEYEE